MLSIRTTQIEALQLAARQRLEERVTAHLRRRCPGGCAALGEAALDAEVVRGIERALDHGVTTVESLAFLCGWFFELGDRFERSPAGDEALAILQDPTYPGQIKVLLIGECLDTYARGRVMAWAPGDDGAKQSSRETTRRQTLDRPLPG